MEHKQKPLNILVVSFDWRNIFENNFKELKEKLERDRIWPDFNNIFIISWSTRTYYKTSGNIKTFHLRTFFTKFRLAYDFLSIFLVPVILLRKKFKPDVMVVRDFPVVFAGLFAKLIWGTKILFFLGSMPTELAKTRKLGYLRAAYQRLAEITAKPLIDVFVANGTATREYLVKMGVKREEIKIMVEDVISRDKKIIDNSKKGEIRNLYKIEENKKIILSVGRLEQEKGFEALIESFGQLNRDDLVLIIVGEGALKSNLIEKTKSLGIADKVIFAGFVYREGIWDYYNDADVFILLSNSEGNPTVFREAMYMGVPVIGSKIEAIREFVGEDESRGFLWSKEDGIDDLERKIDFCLDPIRRLEMVNGAKAYINKNVDCDYHINDFVCCSIR